MMTSIITRYVALELIKSSLATTLILFVIFMSNALGRVLSDVSEGEVPLGAVFPVLAGQSMKILTLLLPLGFFLGVIFAMGRLYKDHEMVVMHACGYSYKNLYRVLLMILIPLVLLSAWLSIWLSSDMLRYARQSIDENNNVHEIHQLKPGQFNPNSRGDRVFFVQSMSDDKSQINDLVIAQLGDKANMLQIAEQGRNDVNEASGDLFLEVGPGTRYEGVPGRKDYKIIDYATHGILLAKKAAKITALKSEEKTISDLLESSHPRDRSELMWRFNVPVIVIVLGLLAVPLAYISPRQGRYGKVGVSILLYIVYLNLIGVSKTGLETGQVPLWLNFWWVHLLFLVLTLFLIRRRVGRLFNIRSVKA